jgi:phosphoserine phosphatase
LRWPHYEHVIFDCDSTLTTIEGIDVLAESADKKWRVEVLTRAAMDGMIDLGDVYEKRLTAVKPTQGQVHAIRQAYKHNIVADAAATIAALKQLGHKVYIISGGLYEPVAEFGVFLGVDRANIRAVSLEYNQLSGKWWRNGDNPDLRPDVHYLTYHQGPLTISNGKAEIVAELLGDQRGRSLLIGDGTSDLLASHAVDLFVGYGGVVSRERVAAESPIFLNTPSLAPLLAVVAGPGMLGSLHETDYQDLAQKAVTLINHGALSFNDSHLHQKFESAFQAAFPTAPESLQINTDTTI